MARQAPQAVYYIDRDSGRRCREIVYGEAELRFLYYTQPGRLLRRLIARRPWFSGVHGWLKRRARSRGRIDEFISRFDVNVSEAEKPPLEYATLDEFFCRGLRPGVRPICAHPRALVSPADGRVLALRIAPQARFAIKGQWVSVADLLGDSGAGEQLAGGWALVVRLAPKDYHRFHFPAGGNAGPARAIPGWLESVHPLALEAGARSFRNQRCITVLHTPLGQVFMVEVGAMTVGTIEQTYRPGPVLSGAEKGRFRFGGSTVVLLWGRDGPQVDADLQANSQAGLETLVRYGTQVARLPVAEVSQVASKMSSNSGNAT